jgi:membrane-associated protein
MENLTQLLDIFLHLDKYLSTVIDQYGAWVYLMLFLVIFLETGVVIIPFLPGDSLLFAAGALAAINPALNPFFLFALLCVAAVLGDTVNYWIGHTIGPRAFTGSVPFLKQEYLVRTQKFYDKHGGKTIFLARFVPIIRTFAPFVAGVGQMNYRYFITYNVVGGIVWTALFVFMGYFFGNLPFVKNNFELVIIAIIAISLLPPIYEYWQHRAEKAAMANN